MPTRLSKTLRPVRVDSWWYAKPPLVLAVTYILSLEHGLSAWTVVRLSLVLLGLLLCVATYGYVINDIFDIEEDRRAGKPNRLEGVSMPARGLLLGLPVLLGPLLLRSESMRVSSLLVLCASFLISTLYSVPPARLKDRGLPGALCDATAAHILPTLLVIDLTAAAAGVPFLASTTGLLALAWGALLGLRGILTHQLQDEIPDRAAGAATFVLRVGARPVRRAVQRFLFPAEVLAFCALVVFSAPQAPIALAFIAAFLWLERLRMAQGWKQTRFVPEAPDTEPYLPLFNNELYENWWPLALALQVGLRSGVDLATPLLFIVAFRHKLRVNALMNWHLIRTALGMLDPPLPDSVDQLPAPPPRTPGELEIIVGTEAWALSGVNVFSANLVRELRRRGRSAHVLITEESSSLVTTNGIAMPKPSDVPFAYLPVPSDSTWGQHWGAMIRYLESRAPCIYIPNSDWRHSCVVPRLSRNVGVVGVVHSDDPLHYDHASRLGRDWDAVVAVSSQIAASCEQEVPALAGRVETIPIGVDIPEAPPSARPQSDHLRVIYHGTLRQIQKRVLDLPAIAQHAVDAGVPLTLTIVGGGPEEEALRAAAADLVGAGVIRFLGVIAHAEILQLLEVHDVYLLTSEFEGMPNALLEAMGRGCVPVVSQMKSAIPDLVENGVSGLLMPVGDCQGAAERLVQLHRDPALRSALSLGAHTKVNAGRYRIRDMVDAYERIFARVNAAMSTRPDRSGELHPPPKSVAAETLFSADLPYYVPSVGHFASRYRDYFEYRLELAKMDEKKVPPYRVIVGLPTLDTDGVSRYVIGLVRALRAQGVDARVLLTEARTLLIRPRLRLRRRPAGVPVDHLPVSWRASWGGHWGALLGYLHAQGPCVYLPNQDFRHSCIVPQLDKQVRVVGVLHSDDPFHRDHVQRLGRFWDAALTFDERVAETAVAIEPSLAERTAVVPYGIGGLSATAMGRAHKEVFDYLFGLRDAAPRHDRNAAMVPPPAEVDGVGVFPIALTHEVKDVGLFPRAEPDYREFLANSGARR